MKPIGLIKFSKNKYLFDLIDNGNLCFNPINYFRNSEKKELEKHRYDQYEGYDKIIQPKEIAKITIKGRDFPVDQNSNRPIAMDLSNGHDFTHLCCFTIIYDNPIKIDDKERIFNPKMFCFNDSLIFIPVSKLDIFMNKIVEFCNTENIKCEGKKVEYVDFKIFSGDLGIFKKDKFYEYQNEFRIALSLNRSDKHIINLGNLSDCVFGPIEKEKCINLVEKGIAKLS
jgi:hypothetical protein